MNESVKNKTCRLSAQDLSHEAELLAAFALPGGVPDPITADQLRRFRDELRADPEISPAVKHALLSLSDRQLAARLR